MTTVTQKQSGSATAIVVMVLTLALIGVLGVIVWQNFLAPKASHVQETGEAANNTTANDAKTEQKVYTNDALSFKYPASGWVAGETRYGEDASPTPELKSSDYQQTGMGVDKGAIISIVTNKKSTTIDKEFADLQNSASVFKLEELQKTTISSQPAITYHSGYEGVRYHTIFVRGDVVYDIVYMFAYGGEASDYMDTYNLVTSLLQFKQ